MNWWTNRRGEAPLIWCVFFGALLLALGLSGSAMAQMEHRSGEPVSTQFVIVVDDSGSMRVRTAEGPAADPDRLALFATRSLLSLLDDRDEVTVTGLNAAASGEEMTAIDELNTNREALESLLAMDAAMAQYPGQRTPCAQALAAVRDELNDAYRPNVNQVVLFLTDGECNGQAVDADQWLAGVDAHGEEAFQFYLLRWQGRRYSDYLVDLANASKGTVSVVGGDDPTELLEPFASVMSRAQGYESYLLDPEDAVLPAHLGARRVRLLAVAPGGGSELSFEVSAQGSGESPEVMGAERSGLHQFEDGGRYRYAVLEYRPGTAPVNVSVSGAGSDWQVVALPEYRLKVSTSITAGRCGESNEEVSFSEVGGAICLTMALTNEDGEEVTEDVIGRGIEATVSYDEPGESGRRLPADQVNNGPRFQLERANLEEGDHIFAPEIILHGPQGARVPIAGPSRTLQVSTRRVAASPSRLELGDLLPGTEHYDEVTIDGNFPTTRGRLVVEGRERLPECLSFALNGVDEGQAQPISAGQTYTVETHVAPYCGSASNEFPVDTALRLQFDRSSGSAPIPTLVMPIRASLIHQVETPAELDLSLRAGDGDEAALVVGGNHQKRIEFTALIPAGDERDGWPGDDLELSLVDGDGEVRVEGDEGALELAVSLPSSSDAQNQPLLTVRADSDACCGGGDYETRLVLVPSSGAAEPLEIPIVVSVDEVGLWKCWGPTVLWALLIALILLLLAYIFNMWRSSNFIDRDALAERLIPLQWDEFGEARPRTESTREVRAMVRRSMSFVARAKAWFKANPLVFGLPGREYFETVELVLSGSPNIQRSRLRLIGERAFIDEIEKRPRRAMARLYATVRGGLTFYAVVAEEDRVGVFAMQRDFPEYGGDEVFEPELEGLRRRTEFLMIHSDREPDAMAGWRVG